MTTPRANAERRTTSAGGFTLLELLVTVTMISLVIAIIVPNLGSFLPSARLSGSGKQLLRTIDWVRSEARIQARRMSLELDLERARWRVVFPAEMRLTLDENEADLAEWSFDVWTALEDGVVFAGAGDARHGMAKKDVYRITFDEHGFSSDQIVVLKLASEPQMVWALTLRGLTGAVTVHESDQGVEPELQYVEEGAF